MKTKIIFIGASVFLYVSFHIPIASAETKKIIISEIQITGGSGHTNDEFVELYNTENTDQTLTNWELRKKTKGDDSARGALFHKFEGNLTISAGKYFLWTNKDSNANFIDLFDIQSKNKTSPNLTDDNSLGLYDNTNVLIDAITWGSGHKGSFSPSSLYPDNPPGGKSLTRDVTTLILSLSDKPSPTNSRDETYEDPPPPIYASHIRLNEILPNPSEKGEANEFIELYNDSDETVSLTGWSIKKDRSESGKYLIKAEDFPKGTDIPAGGFFLIPRKISGFIMANSNKTISLYDPSEKEASAVSYATTKEDVSLNYTATGWRGSTPTPGTANVLNNLPETREKVPKKGYRGVAVDFDARGKDSDRDTLKYTWDFGDGHKSYKEKTSHAYEENGTYTVALKTNDGKDDTVETFTIKIESYPHPEVRITSLMPNPAGNDTDNEWVMIENREKKTVNLKGYGIATGWKKLSNHPIREDFFIEPKSEAKLTRLFSLFTLPNQKGKIELRAPDGKVLQKIKYKLEKSIGENIVYQKKKGQRWKFEESIIKNILSSDTPEETAATDETAPPENNNEETPPPTPTENVQEEKEPEIIPPPISLEPHRPKPQELLAYGTRVRLPDIITLAPPATEKEASLPETDSIPLSLAERFASHINTSLNGLLNDF